MVLADHRRVHDGIDRGNYGAAEGRRQIFEIHRLDSAVQKIHSRFLLFARKSRTGNRHLSLSLVRLLFLKNSPPSERTVCILTRSCRNVNLNFFRLQRHAFGYVRTALKPPCAACTRRSVLFCRKKERRYVFSIIFPQSGTFRPASRQNTALYAPAAGCVGTIQVLLSPAAIVCSCTVVLRSFPSAA